MKKHYFPSNAMLEEAIIKALEIEGGEASVTTINNHVISILQLPDEIVEMEDENDTGTKLNYRLRWCRTNLKSKGKIESVERGTWKLA
jgi:hypothetical protein